MVLQWPRKAQAALAYFFRPLQDLDIYVEDANDVVFYTELFKRIAPKRVRIARVFPAGHRLAVIKQARTYDFSGRPALFLVDGDFEWVRDEPPPGFRGVHRLAAYCIENLLIDEMAAVQVLVEEEALIEGDAKSRLAFADWVNEICSPLVNLFISFAVLNAVCPEKPTVGVGVSRVITNGKKRQPPDLDPQKVDRLRARTDKQIATVVGEERAKELLERVRTRVHSLERPLDVVSGKDFVMPLFEFRLKRCTKAAIRRVSLRMRLARHCNLLRFEHVTAALESAVSHI